MTFWNQIQSLFDLILISCLYFVFWIFNIEVLNLAFFTSLALPFIIIFALPVIIIHLNYYLVSARVIYEIKEESFEVNQNNINREYSITDVNKIFIFMTPNRLKDSAVRSFPFENYYYIELQMIDGGKLLMTCLHSRKIDKIIEDNFRDIEIIKVKSIFPLIRKCDTSTISITK